MLSAIATLAAIGWDPEVRGILVVVTAVLILCGSIYLVVATNTGSRLGFLIAFGGLTGWMLIMGVIWTLYGIGWEGRAPEWEVNEVVTGDLSVAETAPARDLTDWNTLAEEDSTRSEAQAVVDGYVVDNGVFDSTGHFVSVAAYQTGGKTQLENKRACSIHRPSTYGGCWDRITNHVEQTLQLKSPTNYMVIELQAAHPDAEGTPVVEPSAPVVSVILIRDLGNERQIPALFALVNLILFSVTVWLLHEREKRAMAVRTAA